MPMMPTCPDAMPAPAYRFADCIALAARAVTIWRCGGTVLSISLPDARVDAVGDMSEAERAAVLLSRLLADQHHAGRGRLPHESAEAWADDIKALAELGAGSEFEQRAALVTRAILAEHRSTTRALARRIERDGLLFADELAAFAHLHRLTNRPRHALFSLRH